MNEKEFELMAERMIRVSKAKPLLPETFVPWEDEPGTQTLYMPLKMVSLEGHSLWTNLSCEQRIELGRLEVVQVMYSYAWSETLACHFFNRHLLTLNPDSVEYRFLIRELIEEYRHQEMFGMAIRRLGRKPEPPTTFHAFLGNFTARYFPASLMFMSVLSIEMMADIYAKHIRKDETVYSVLRKVSELHHIEEGRHIFYTRAWLERYTNKAGFFKRTVYSLVILLNILFMRSLYVKRTFFDQLGLQQPDVYYKAALKNYSNKFGDIAMGEVVEFVQSINGFNWLTKPLWRSLLKVRV